MTTPDLATLGSLIDGSVPAGRERDTWQQARERVNTKGAAALPTALSDVARSLGRELLVEPDHSQRWLRRGELVLDLAALRVVDAAGTALLAHCLNHGEPASLLRQCFDRGDLDERVMALRALVWADDDDAIRDLLGEAHRSNTLDLFEAGACDSNLASRRLDDDDLNRMILKMAFMDLPLWRMPEAVTRANAELSRTLLDFAREREAAGRPVWADTIRLIARAPVDGAVARVVGALEHGRHDLRLAAAESLPELADPELRGYLEQRLRMEMRSDVQQMLRTALERLNS